MSHYKGVVPVNDCGFDFCDYSEYFTLYLSILNLMTGFVEGEVHSVPKSDAKRRYLCDFLAVLEVMFRNVPCGSLRDVGNSEKDRFAAVQCFAWVLLTTPSR